LYLLTVFLYPPDLSEAEEHQGRFERNRSGITPTFIAMCLLDIAQTAVHGELFQPVWYVPFVGQYALLAVGGLCARRRRLRSIFCVYQLVTLLAWALVFRKTLQGNAMACFGKTISPPPALFGSFRAFRYPFIPRTRISDSLHDAHVSNAVFEIWMRMHATF